jgi:hypothetical protein
MLHPLQTQPLTDPNFLHPPPTQPTNPHPPPTHPRPTHTHPTTNAPTTHRPRIQVTHSGAARSLTKEVGMASISSILLGAGALFLTLWFGIYV